MKRFIVDAFSDRPFADNPAALLLVGQAVTVLKGERAKQHYRRNDFSKIVYAGDAQWDLLATQRLGIGFIGVQSNRDAATFVGAETSVVNDFSRPTVSVRLLQATQTGRRQ